MEFQAILSLRLIGPQSYGYQKTVSPESFRLWRTQQPKHRFYSHSLNFLRSTMVLDWKVCQQSKNFSHKHWSTLTIQNLRSLNGFRQGKCCLTWYHDAWSVESGCDGFRVKFGMRRPWLWGNLLYLLCWSCFASLHFCSKAWKSPFSTQSVYYFGMHHKHLQRRGDLQQPSSFKILLSLSNHRLFLLQLSVFPQLGLISTLAHSYLFQSALPDLLPKT